jgi:hypothetical protein
MNRRLDRQQRRRFRYVCTSVNGRHVFVIEVGKDDLAETDEDATIDCLRCPVCHSPAALASEEAEVWKIYQGIAGVTKRGRAVYVNTQAQSKVENAFIAVHGGKDYSLTFAELRLIANKLK